MKPMCNQMSDYSKHDDNNLFCLSLHIFFLNNFIFPYWPTEGFGEMFEGYFADRCAENVRLCPWRDKRHRPVCADGERGPPSAEIYIKF